MLACRLLRILASEGRNLPFSATPDMLLPRNSASTIILGGHNIYGEDGGILNVAATTCDGLLWIANPNGCKFMCVFRILTHLPALMRVENP